MYAGNAISKVKSSDKVKIMTVRGTSFAGNSREYLLDTPLGPIKAETDAALAAHAIGDTLAFDLPVDKAASLKVFS